MAYPINAEVLQGIAKASFASALKVEESNRVYPKICQPMDQDDLTVTYTSFGGVPEPRQLSGTVAGGSVRQAKSLSDYKLAVTVAEWEDTVTVPRSVIETNPAEITRITRQMAQKAQIYMDKYLVGTVLPDTTANGYDGAALYSVTHAETGANQINTVTDAVTGVSATHPTSAEFEIIMDQDIASLKGFTDNVGTPVNDGVSRFQMVVPLEFEQHCKVVFGQTGAMVAGGGADSTGGLFTGRYRGMFEVYGSAFVASADRIYIFCVDVAERAVALIKNKDWEFNTNIGTDSDMWQYGQTALFTAYARWTFVPWNWKSTLLQIYT